MEIDKELMAEIKEYCVLNSLKPREFVHKLLKKAFMEEKYGKMPAVLQKNVWESPKIIEVPKELRQTFEENIVKAVAVPQNEENPGKNEPVTVESVEKPDKSEKNAEETKLSGKKNVYLGKTTKRKL